jgi:uncharacterized protein YmfQ (DUF2313 family)
MENNKMQEIYNRLITDQTFAEELKKFEEGKEITTPEESAAAFIEFAKLQGYDITIEELKAFAENQSKALSEEELDSVNAAGIATWLGKTFLKAFGAAVRELDEYHKAAEESERVHREMCRLYPGYKESQTKK